MIKLWLQFCLICFVAFTGQAQTSTQVELLLSHAQAKPGSVITAALRLKMAPRWHTYWINPGDSGTPTKLNWTLPDGIKAGAIEWPAPEKLLLSGLVTYVYHEEVLLVVPLELGPNLKPGTYEIKAKASWLECETVCIPGRKEVKATLLIGSEEQPSPAAESIRNGQQKLPRPDPQLVAKGSYGAPTKTNERTVTLEFKLPTGVAEYDFFPYKNENYEVGNSTTNRISEGGASRLVKTVTLLEGTVWPTNITGLVTWRMGVTAKPLFAEVSLNLTNDSAAAPTALATPAGLVAPEARPGLLKMLFLAFLGGLILNVMPCVLPVIALKILGFVQQSKKEPGQTRKLGIIYGLGVWTSFLILGGMVVAVQQAGGAASWGMQMQNPFFRLAMLVVVFLVALNLFGFFEVMLGSGALTAADSLAGKQGGAGAFFNGVLTTALATPCTAPFLAVALGFAFTQSPFVVLLMFSVTALGLALPYIVLSWRPDWLKFLPRPGAWMEKFKMLMAFPMLATAVWLFDFTAPSFGKSGSLWLGLFLVVLAMVGWIYGEFVQRGRQRTGLALAVCAGLLAFGYGYLLERQLDWRHPQRRLAAGDLRESPDGIAWQPWTAAAVNAAQAAGKPVLVDFTAVWCLICQANKASSLEIASVRAKLKDLGYVALLADNSDLDPLIATELVKHGRAGVPLVLVYPGKPGAPPEVLPTVLTPGIVLAALERAATGSR